MTIVDGDGGPTTKDATQHSTRLPGKWETTQKMKPIGLHQHTYKEGMTRAKKINKKLGQNTHMTKVNTTKKAK